MCIISISISLECFSRAHITPNDIHSQRIYCFFLPEPLLTPKCYSVSHPCAALMPLPLMIIRTRVQIYNAQRFNKHVCRAYTLPRCTSKECHYWKCKIADGRSLVLFLNTPLTMSNEHWVVECFVWVFAILARKLFSTFRLPLNANEMATFFFFNRLHKLAHIHRHQTKVGI